MLATKAMRNDNDNSGTVKRHIVALTMLEQDARALHDVRSFLRSCILPVEDYMPGSRNFADVTVDVKRLESFDLPAAIERIRDGLVLPPIYTDLENRIDASARSRFVLEHADLNNPSPEYVRMLHHTYEKFWGFLEENYAGVSPSMAFIFVVAAKMPEIAYAGALDKVSDVIVAPLKKDILSALKKNIKTIACPLQENPDQARGVLRPFVIFAQHTATSMVDEIGAAVMALEQWRDAKMALAQWNGWREKGRPQPFAYGRDYLTPLSPS